MAFTIFFYFVCTYTHTAVLHFTCKYQNTKFQQIYLPGTSTKFTYISTCACKYMYRQLHVRLYFEVLAWVLLMVISASSTAVHVLGSTSLVSEYLTTCKYLKYLVERDLRLFHNVCSTSRSTGTGTKFNIRRYSYTCAAIILIVLTVHTHFFGSSKL